MPCHCFYMIPALSTLGKVRAAGAYCPAALVFPVSIPVCGVVGQQFMIRTDVTVVMLIINILMLWEKPLLGHRSFVREKRTDPFINQQLCNARRLVPCICYQCFYPDAFDLVIQNLESPAVMMVAQVDAVTKDPFVLITCSLYVIGKYIFMLDFAEPSTLRVRRACLNCFFFFSVSVAGWRILTLVFIFFFQRTFSMCFPIFVDLFFQLFFKKQSFLDFDTSIIPEKSLKVLIFTGLSAL